MAGRASPQLVRLLAAQEQGLWDLAATMASDVVFVREHRAPPSMFFEAIERRALDLGFVVSTTSMAEDHGFESLDVVVKSFSLHLRGGDGDEKGLAPLLDAYAEKRGRRAVQAFDEACDAVGLAGDLYRLARAYLSAKEAGAEAKRIRAFFNGTEASHADDDSPIGALNVRTAKRTLADLSRLVRALDKRGLLLIARRAALLTELPPAQRESAYTVLRELVDNADGPRGTVATRIYVSGADELFEGRRALGENAPLATRTLDDAAPEAHAFPLPHSAVIHLEAPEPEGEHPVRKPEEIEAKAERALRSVIRASAGVPPIDQLDKLTVGYERIDEALDALFMHSENAGSVFSLLSGDYGTGKTHLLLHVTARALSEKRPVLRLSVERLDTDLGNPQRHLRRLIENTVLPGSGLPAPSERLEAWRRSEAGARKLTRTLEAIAESESDAAPAARRALRAEEESARALEICLGGFDLEPKPGSAGYRQDAYARLLLWLELLERIDGTAGPVVLIDEAENLYRGGTSRPERRTALRSLAFYCGGALPRACVIFAVTPETLEMLREEAEEMLSDISEQRTVLPWEDVTMLRRRLLRSRAIEVAKLGKEQLAELASRIKQLHRNARGAQRDPDWDRWLERAITGRPSPREVVRAVVTRLESLWWTGRPPP